AALEHSRLDDAAGVIAVPVDTVRIGGESMNPGSSLELQSEAGEILEIPPASPFARLPQPDPRLPAGQYGRRRAGSSRFERDARVLAAERLGLAGEIVAEPDDLEAGFGEKRFGRIERGLAGRDHAHLVVAEPFVPGLRRLERRIIENAAKLRKPRVAIAGEDIERVVPRRAVGHGRTGRDIGRVIAGHVR